MSEVTVKETKIKETTCEKEVTVCDRDGCDLTSEDGVEFLSLYSGVTAEERFSAEISEVSDRFDGKTFERPDKAVVSIGSNVPEAFVRDSLRIVDGEVEVEFKTFQHETDITTAGKVDICQRCAASLFTDVDPAESEVDHVIGSNGIEVRTLVEEKSWFTVMLDSPDVEFESDVTVVITDKIMLLIAATLALVSVLMVGYLSAV